MSILTDSKDPEILDLVELIVEAEQPDNPHSFRHTARQRLYIDLQKAAMAAAQRTLARKRKRTLERLHARRMEEARAEAHQLLETASLPGHGHRNVTIAVETYLYGTDQGSLARSHRLTYDAMRQARSRGRKWLLGNGSDILREFLQKHTSPQKREALDGEVLP